MKGNEEKWKGNREVEVSEVKAIKIEDRQRKSTIHVVEVLDEESKTNKEYVKL